MLWFGKFCAWTHRLEKRIPRVISNFFIFVLVLALGLGWVGIDWKFRSRFCEITSYKPYAQVAHEKT
jgi:hypothetical protein